MITQIDIGRREHLLGLLVYFPELASVARREESAVELPTGLADLLQPGDDRILAEITAATVAKAREAVFKQFATDFPVGF